MTTYSNPRLSATIDNWPLGGSKRGTAIFVIEQTKRGERAMRSITGEPKKLTYATKARIVDGDDGRTYIAELTSFGFVSIMRGDMKIQEEAIFPEDTRYPSLRALFD